jgi:putative acetyltransferase
VTIAVALRALEPRDARAVHQLVTDPEVARTGGAVPFESEDVWIQRLGTPKPDRVLLLGAFDRDALVGFGSIETHASVRRRHVGSIGLALAPRAQGQGIGARLLDALVSSGESWFGHVRIELCVHADHARAIALYDKHGFVVETQRRADMLRDGDLVDALGMARIREGFVPPPELGAPPPIPARRGRLTPLLRARRKTDAAQMARLHSEPSVMEGTWQMPFQSEAAWAARFEVTPAGATIIVAELDGTIVGSAGLFPIGTGPRTRHNAMFGIAVHPDVQGAGVGDALLRAILAQADGWLGLRRVELDVFVDNERARILYERHGFVLEGRARMTALRRGTFVDSFAMARIRP